MTREWVWLDRAVILAIHDMQLAEHGGGAGVRDAGLLDSALGKPLHLQAYGEPPPDAAALAASYNQLLGFKFRGERGINLVFLYC